MLSIRIKISIPLLFLAVMGISLYPIPSKGQSLPIEGSFCTASLWHLDFTALSTTVRKVLTNFGFELEHQMADEDRIHLAVEDVGLRLDTFDQAFGFMVKKDLHIDDIDHIEIEWGGNRLPVGCRLG
jgi:hypothetical protein